MLGKDSERDGNSDVLIRRIIYVTEMSGFSGASLQRKPLVSVSVSLWLGQLMTNQ